MTGNKNQQTLSTWNDTNTSEPDTTSTDQTETQQEQTPESTGQPDPPTDQTDQTQHTNTDANACTDETPTEPQTTPTAPSTPDDTTPATASDTPFDFTRDDLTVDSEHALTEQAITELVDGGSPSPPLSDQIRALATHAPEPASTGDRIARACYILARAQTGTLPGYTLEDSMVPLRDHIEAELRISFADIAERGIITEKRVLGKQKYFRLTRDTRETLRTGEFPTPGVLDDTIPILRDGPIHNRSVLAGATWLLTTQDVTRVEKPHFGTDSPVDLAGYRDDQRVWLGEVVAAEDDADAVSARLAMLRDTDAQVVLIVENSAVAVDVFDALHDNGILDIPPDVTYRNFSIAQFRNRLYPELDDRPFDRLTALTTLLQ